jgi:hypothetical protein
LSSHKCLGPPNSLFPSGFPPKILYVLLTCPMNATFPAHFIHLDLITLIISGEVHKLRSSSLLQSSPVSHQFLPLMFKHFPQHLFSNILNLCSSLSVRDPVSHPYKTT